MKRIFSQIRSFDPPAVAWLALIIFAVMLMPALLSEKSVIASSAQRRNAVDNRQPSDSEIDSLSNDLLSDRDIEVIVNEKFLSRVAEQFANASPHDILVKLLPGRILSTKSDLGFAKYQNYLDLESGDGFVDLRHASVENIKNGRIHLLIDVAGQVRAQARGKQIGFNYTATPQIGISMHEQLPFIIEAEEGEFRLRPASKQLNVHLDITVPVSALGTDVNASQDLPFDLSLVMHPIALPSIISTNLRMSDHSRPIALTNTSYRAENGRLQFDADLGFSNAIAEKGN